MAHPDDSDLLDSLRVAWNRKHRAEVPGYEREWDDCWTPALVTITGWVRTIRAGGVDTCRIYRDPALTCYWEVDEADVIYWVATGQDLDDPERVWVRQGAVTRFVSIQPGRAEAAARPFGGPIVQGYLAPPSAYPVTYPYPYQAPGGPPVWPQEDGDGGGWEGTGCRGTCLSH
jgi:hypothetical protein